MEYELNNMTSSKMPSKKIKTNDTLSALPRTSTVSKSPRRGFLQKCLAALGSLGFLMAAYPLIRYIEPPPEADGNSRVEIDLNTLPLGSSQTVIYQGRPTIVVNTPDGYSAYNAVCPHLGCVVKWETRTQNIVCPCQGGKFGTDGSVLGGPIPGPLKPVSLSISNDKIIVGS